MKKYIRASELSGEQLADYINKVKKNVEIDLEDVVEEINWDMDDEEVKVLVEFLDDNRATFFFEIWRFSMNPYYIASDADIITNTIRNYMKKHQIPSRDDSISDWEELKRKSVMDSDGFWTEYTLYVNGDHDRYICIFGDSDYYTPETADPDWEGETYEQAMEWFDNYYGFEEEKEWIDDSDGFEEEIESSTSAKKMNATEVVRWMYNNYPDWAFYDEHELADGRIQLKFESGPKNQKADLEEDLEELGIYPVFRNGLYIIVSEDPEYVIESSEEFFDKDEDAVYWYRTTHGVQPGSVPKGLEILQVIDRADGTYFSTNRVITTDALKYYDIKEKSPYIKSSQSAKKFVGRTYSDLIQDIENKSKYTVDSAYLRRRKADNWIQLYDEKGQSYSAEITEYSDGSFELMEYNITKDVE